MPKTQYIIELGINASLNDVFLLTARTASKQTARNTDLFRVNGTIADRTGTLPFVMFDVDGQTAEMMKEGVIVRVIGDVVMSRYLGRPEAKVTKIDAAPDDVKDEDLAYSPAPPLADMRRELFSLVRGISDPNLKMFLTDEFFGPGAKFLQDFQEAPAGSSNHHAYRHGLLQHTLEVTRTAKALALSSANQPAPNVDIVVAGALLHDIGKVEEFIVEGLDIKRSTRGDLLGHVVLGILRLEAAINSFNFGAKETEGELSQDQAAHLLHISASHHGKREYGSPVEPMTMEADIVHTADSLSVNQLEMSEFNRSYVEGGRPAVFSEKRRGWLYARPLIQ